MMLVIGKKQIVKIHLNESEVREMKELYGKNEDFRDYVDAYCKKHEISKDEAFSHKIVVNVGEYYSEKSKSKVGV